jgi:ubiquitin C-terminal hydrolase
VRFKDIPQGATDYLNIRERYFNLIKKADSTESRNRYIKAYREYQANHSNDVIIANSYMYWKNYIKKSHSIIIDIFSGMFYSKITCLECKNISGTFEAFNILSIELPFVQRTCGIHELLDNFTRDEELTSDNKFQCEYCGRLTNATKQIKIWELPNVMIIQLKRFKSHAGFNRKITTEIGIPIINFNMQNYTSDIHPQSNTIYDLCAIVDHQGVCDGGHYLAYCKNALNNEWYEYNDSHVTHIDKEIIGTVLNSDSAYLLFYTRRFDN